MASFDLTSADSAELLDNNNEAEDFERVSDPLYGIIDADWIGQAFLVKSSDLSELDRINRTWSTADLKFTDSSIGGNIVINPVPQPSRLTDPRARSRRRGRRRVSLAMDADVGMGPWYSKTIDDNAEILHIQCGVKEFNSLATFWTRSVDYAQSVIVNNGRLPTAYNVGNWVGTAAVFVAFPAVTTIVYGAKALLQLMESDKPFAYYYMKPDMVSFWKTANILVTQFCIESGILAPTFMSDNTKADRIGVPVSIDQDDLEEIKKILPRMFTKNNNIDLMFLAGRSQALANAQLIKEKELFEEGALKNNDFIGYVREVTSLTEKASQGQGVVAALNKVLSFANYDSPQVGKFADEIQSLEDVERAYQESGAAAYGYKDPYVQSAGSDTSPTTDIDNPTNDKDDGFVGTATKEIKDFFNATLSSFDASVRGGGAYLNLKVDHIGSMTDSIDNSTTSIPAEGMTKQLSGNVKEFTYNFAGGNIVEGMDKIVNAVGDFAKGALDGITFGLSSAIPALFGGGFIDLPLMWDDSSFQAATTSFTVELLSPGGDNISKLIHEWIPLAAIMAAGSPRAIGKNAYGSPFLCSAFIKGKLKIDMGMITAISITRGTANLPYSKDKKPMGFSVTFTISDFSQRMSLPVQTSAFGSFFGSFDDSSMINRYISTICARDLFTNKFSIPRAKLKLSRTMMALDTATSASFFGARTGSVLNPILGGMLYENSLTLLHTNDLNR